MRQSPLTLAALTAFALPALAQSPTLEFDNGVLGQSVTYSVDGPAGEIFVLLPSFQSGPTPLAAFDPTATEALEVGLDLLNFLTVGFAPGNGIYPLPANPNLAGQVLNAQAFTLTPLLQVSGVTNPARFTLGASNFVSETLAPNSVARQGHTLTTLADGKRAVAIGGLETTATGSNVVQSAEIYDATTQSFDLFPAALAAPRTVHTATLLDDGRVLVLGGTDAADVVTSSGEIFDPATGTSTPTAPMSTPRTQHTATRLDDGRVLVIGGVSNFDLADPLAALDSAIGSSEVYDPVSDSWSGGPNLPNPTFGHTATLLPSGNVLVVGGVRVASLFGLPVPSISDTCRRYVASSNAFTSVPNIPGPRVYHGAATLADGRALVFGGADGNLVTLVFAALRSSYTYSETSNTWTTQGNLSIARGYVEAARAASGDVLAAGGLATVDVASGTGLPALSIERFDPDTGQWSTAGAQIGVRNIPRATVVDNGRRLLIVGGADQVGTTALNPAAELFID